VFKNLDDATDKLFQSIPKLTGENWLILSISDNGEKIGLRLSTLLNLPHQRLYMESIPCQNNNNCEIAVITEFKNAKIDEVLKDAFQLDKEILASAIEVIYDFKLLPKIEKIRGSREPLKIDKEIDKIILVDETIETGLTMETAISTVADIIGVEDIYIATPIIPENMFYLFESLVEKIFYSEMIEMYTDIEDYYLERENL